ncbi:DUF4190 domain-containing protein [Streptomyces beihaiensis]|uniref:DUF4352 domain-containing protein n=1 Tax=Streptomyces beihaiensis TaxID=2984495 RepID=A0ABT3U3H7_9ACTN|nr:DUF4190 domain-containing protein [Streptomyces beihaiensis]MCX3063877.1 DUF4352 domain-containing protein [Streptomyces beihaiensis]
MSQHQQHPQYPPFQQPHQPQQPQQPQIARNGLGTAALILGIIGALSGLVPIMFWLAGVLGVIALILGLAGRGRVKRGEATNKGVALAGVLLALASLGLAVFGAYTTFKAVGDAVDQIDKSVSDTKPKETKPSGAAKDSGKPGASGKPGKSGGKADTAKAHAAGDSVIYDDNLTVTVSNAVAFNPSPYAAGHTKGHDAYKVTITVTNNSKKRFDASMLTADARAGQDGVQAEQIFDDKVGSGFDGTILPGKKATVVYGFDTPAAAKNLTVEVTPSFDYDAQQWDLKL